MSEMILLLIKKQPRFSSQAILKIADIVANIGSIALGSISIPFLIDNFNFMYVILSISAAITFWGISIWIVNNYYG